MPNFPLPSARVVTRDGLTAFVYGPFPGVELGDAAKKKLAVALDWLGIGMVRNVLSLSGSPDDEHYADSPDSVVVIWEPTQAPDRHSAEDLVPYVAMYILGHQAALADVAV